MQIINFGFLEYSVLTVSEVCSYKIKVKNTWSGLTTRDKCCNQWKIFKNDYTEKQYVPLNRKTVVTAKTHVNKCLMFAVQNVLNKVKVTKLLTDNRKNNCSKTESLDGFSYSAHASQLVYNNTRLSDYLHDRWLLRNLKTAESWRDVSILAFILVYN